MAVFCDGHQPWRRMRTSALPLLLTLLVLLQSSVTCAFVSPSRASATSRSMTLAMTEESLPATFREAEVKGLQYMSEGSYQEALTTFQKGLKLPGSKADVVRNKLLSGPSPVGGAMGGFESKNTLSLDEFELQAANYNMACAYAQLGQIQESIQALEVAFQEGFDNFSTVREDPDLDPIKQETTFLTLMQKYEANSKGGFNPFGFLGKK